MSLILIVEDNADNRKLLEVILVENNYSVLSEIEGVAGAKTAIERRPDLILMDINMPGIDGYGALKLLRENKSTKDIPVIAVTGNATIADREQMVAANFDHIITKPFGIDEILSAITDTLSGGESGDRESGDSVPILS